MSLREKLSAKIDKAWQKLDDVPIPAVLSYYETSGYDTTTGGTTRTSVDYNVTVVLDTLTEEESAQLTGGNGQFRALVPFSQLPLITPKIGDALTIDSEAFAVIGVDSDPARVLWTGFLAKKGTLPDGIL